MRRTGRLGCVKSEFRATLILRTIVATPSLAPRLREPASTTCDCVDHPEERRDTKKPEPHQPPENVLLQCSGANKKNDSGQQWERIRVRASFSLEFTPAPDVYRDAKEDDAENNAARPQGAL